MAQTEQTLRATDAQEPENTDVNQTNDTANANTEDGRRRYLMSVEGLLPNPGVWVRLLDQESDQMLTEAEAAELREQLDQLMDVVVRSFRDGDRAVLTLGTAKVNVQSFAAIRMELIPL